MMALAAKIKAPRDALWYRCVTMTVRTKGLSIARLYSLRGRYELINAAVGPLEIQNPTEQEHHSIGIQ